MWKVGSLLAVALIGCSAGREEITEAAGQNVSSDGRAGRQVVLNFQYQIQETSYWCGPAATRVALSTQIASPPNQRKLAQELPTDEDGTDWIHQVTVVLNKYLGAGTYKTIEMPNDPPTPIQRDQLWSDITYSIDHGYAVVTNIWAPAHNHPPGYPNRLVKHYFTVVGYDSDTMKVYIADSANFSGQQKYWLTFAQLATLIPPKGYSSLTFDGTTCPTGTGTVIGEIEEKYKALGGCESTLGVPKMDQRWTPDKIGRYSVFENGSIYWSPSTGAHNVQRPIRDAWAALQWEVGPLKYPTSDELATDDGVGRFNRFQGGAIYWSPTTGAHEILGRIADKWNELGAEKGLGYPTSGEYTVLKGKKSDFERGSITWVSSTNDFEVETSSPK